MPKNCDGVKLAHSERKSTSAEAPESSINDDHPTEKKISDDTGFRGFISIPHVRLERYDITPYLNGHRRPVTHRKIKKNGAKYNAAHMKRLSQKSFVCLVRDDLEKLKASFRCNNTPSSPVSIYSDSDASGSLDMAVYCKVCNKSYNSEKKLLKHQQNKHIIYTTKKTPKRVSFSDHVIIHEVKEYHKCRKCPKIFEDYKALKRHNKQWHKKRNSYICNYCSRNFVDRMFFKVHIKLHCDVCGELFPSRSKYLEHRRDKCRVFKLFKCKTCELSFFKIMDLKDHSYEHDGVLFVCDICKEHFQTKCAIAHHNAFLHQTKKRPNELYLMRKMGAERLYLCQFCDESSVERDIIEIHVQNLPDLTNKATTGYKDYYFCDQCMKQFDTEADMLQHKWTHFLKTNDNSQTQSKDVSINKPKPKTTYNVNDEIPDTFKPFVSLEKINVDTTNYIDIEIDSNTGMVTINRNDLKKAVVDAKSRKTIVSKYQCETCGKYFSNNYCLSRHISTQHEDFEKLRCKVCEETFVWPSLLKSHKCIRLYRPEMTFDDAREEILLQNPNSTDSHLEKNASFDDFQIEENYDYMNAVDFEIPAPIVELRECDSTFNFMTNTVRQEDYNLPDKNGVTSSGYKLIMQEVPIEF